MEDGLTVMQLLLRIEEPWRVTEFNADALLKQIDVGVGVVVPRDWFGLGGKTVKAGPTQTWRHVNFGTWAVKAHVSAPPGSDLSRVDWAGDEGMPFTHALSRQIFAMHREHLSPSGICSLLGLPLSELKSFADQLKKTHLQAEGDPAPVAAASHAHAAPDDAAEADGDVPAETDAVWAELLSGSRQIDIRVLALKFMLTRARSQLHISNASEEVMAQKTRELRRYFAKNRQLLAHELAELKGRS